MSVKGEDITRKVRLSREEIVDRLFALNEELTKLREQKAYLEGRLDELDFSENPDEVNYMPHTADNVENENSSKPQRSMRKNLASWPIFSVLFQKLCEDLENGRTLENSGWIFISDLELKSRSIWLEPKNIPKYKTKEQMEHEISQFIKEIRERRKHLLEFELRNDNEEVKFRAHPESAFFRGGNGGVNDGRGRLQLLETLKGGASVTAPED